MHKRKMIAPIVITVIVILYYSLYFGVLIHLINEAWAAALFIIPLLISGVMIYVCVQRIKEIKGGEEDDLSNY